MPHLSFDYAAQLEDHLPMKAFAEHMRQAMFETGIFPLGGIRVRGHRASVEAVADGGDWLWLDMVLRIGTGRPPEERQRAVDQLYAAARNFIEPRLGDQPFALSLELREIDPQFSAKSWNTIHRALDA